MAYQYDDEQQDMDMNAYDEYDPDYEYDDYLDAYDDELPPEEKRIRRQGRIKIAKGMFDFVAVIAGLIVTLLLIALIVTLVNWFVTDISTSFRFLFT